MMMMMMVTTLVGDAGLRAIVLDLCTKFEVPRPSRWEDIAHLLCKH